MVSKEISRVTLVVVFQSLSSALNIGTQSGVSRKISLVNSAELKRSNLTNMQSLKIQVVMRGRYNPGLFSGYFVSSVECRLSASGVNRPGGYYVT